MPSLAARFLSPKLNNVFGRVFLAPLMWYGMRNIWPSWGKEILE